jgi:D-tyrosyl-tRNA(Tyr) deacylase
VSLGTLATLATAAVDRRFVHLKRQVVAWGGYHIVACELSAESALFMPKFAQTLPWHYFHAVRTKKVGAAVERQEGLLKAAQFHGLHCH